MGLFKFIGYKGAQVLDNAHLREPDHDVPSRELMMRDPAAYMAGQATGRSGSRSRRHILLGSLSASVMVNMTTGVYLTGFLLSLGADASFINTVVILITMCVLFQMLAPIWLERVQRRRKIIIAMMASAHTMNLIVVPLLVFIGIPNEVMLPLFCVCVTAANMLSALVTPGLQAWQIGNIPEEKRLGFFALNSMINIVILSLVPFFGGILADSLKENIGDTLALSLIRVAMFAFAALQMFFYSRVDEPKYAKSTEKYSLGSVLRCVRAHKEYLTIIMTMFIYNMSANILGPYMTVFLIEELEISYTFLTSVNLSLTALMLGLTPFYKRIIAKFKLNKALFVTVLLYSLWPAGYIFLSAQTIYMFFVTEIYSQLFVVCMILCFAMVPYISLPEENRTVFLSLYNTSQALAAILGMFIGRVIYEAVYDLPLPFGIEPVKVLCVVIGVLSITSAFIMRVAFRERPKGGRPREVTHEFT